MTDVLRNASIAEIMLLFVLLFIVPMLAMMLMQLRKYQQLFGDLPGRRKKEKAKEAPAAVAAAAPAAEEGDAEQYPYRATPFLSQPEKACLAALRDALGDVEVYPKTALWECVEPTDAAPLHADRLRGLAFDYLVCDRGTGQPLTAVMFKPERGEPTRNIDEMRKICAAAGTSLVMLPLAESYDAASLKKTLGIPDLDL